MESLSQIEKIPHLLKLGQFPIVVGEYKGFTNEVMPKVLALASGLGDGRRIGPGSEQITWKAKEVISSWFLNGGITPEYVLSELEKISSKPTAQTKEFGLAMTKARALLAAVEENDHIWASDGRKKYFFDSVSNSLRFSQKIIMDHIAQGSIPSQFEEELVVKRGQSSLISVQFKEKIAAQIFDDPKNPKSLKPTVQDAEINRAIQTKSLTYNQLYRLLAFLPQNSHFRPIVVSEINAASAAMPSDRARRHSNARAIFDLMGHPSFCSILLNNMSGSKQN